VYIEVWVGGGAPYTHRNQVLHHCG